MIKEERGGCEVTLLLKANALQGRMRGCWFPNSGENRTSGEMWILCSPTGHCSLAPQYEL